MILQDGQMDFTVLFQIFQSQATQMHFTRAQVTITQPITWCKRTDYLPKVELAE